jgi:mycothiol synthase
LKLEEVMRIDFPGDRKSRAEALQCLFADDSSPQDRAEEALELCNAGEIDLGGLVGAWIGNRAFAAGLLCILPDGAAFAWPPGVLPDAPRRSELAAGILTALTSRARSQGVRFIQAAVDSGRIDHRIAFLAADFQRIAQLRTLQRPLDRPLKRTANQLVTLVPYDPAIEERFSRVIEQTYLDSLDCPSFGGLRTSAEALRSYRFAGEFTPQRWRLVLDDHDDVAVIIVNDHPADRSREIVYLGVVPQARGAGLARRLVEDAIEEAMSDGCESIVTAVDAANDRAFALYSRSGFVPLCERDIFIWQPNSSENS